MRKLFVALSIVALTCMLAVSCSKDNETIVGGGTCSTAGMSFSRDIQPILNANCTTCHNSTYSNGGQNLTTHAGVVNATDNGKLVGVINHTSGYPAMPQGGAKLSDCNISKISAWISQGKLDN